MSITKIMGITEMSISGAVLIFVIVIIRALAVKRLPKKMFLVLWDIALLRLLLPFRLPSALSIYSLVNKLLLESMKNPEQYGNFGSRIASAAAGETTEYASGVFAAGEAPLFHTVPYRTVIWVIGMVFCAAVFAALYYRCQKKFKTSLPVRENAIKQWLREYQRFRRIEIRQSDQIAAPLTYGILRPVILLPKTIRYVGAESLEYILVHEYVHICRFDAAAKLLFVAAVCAHWFNPFVWVMYYLANRDLELSCDETVVKQFGMDSRRSYALAIIQMAQIQSGMDPLCSNFSKNAVEERIEAIMKTKKISVFSGVIAVVLVAAVTAAFATTANETSGGHIGKTMETTVADEMLISRQNENGDIQYSTDGGETFLSEGDFSKQHVFENVEWWTAEEYAAWLEQEKISMKSIIGSKGWNPTDGWYTWTQEMVDEAIAQYEQTLNDIKNGIMVSKPTADGDVVLMLGAAPSETETAVEMESNIAVSSGSSDEILSNEEVNGGRSDIAQDTAEGYALESIDTIRATAESNASASADNTMDIAEDDAIESSDINGVINIIDRYAPFGVIFVKSGDFGNVYWNGKLVEVLEDFAPDGSFTFVSSSDEGGIKIKTVYDSSGKLAGMEQTEG